MQIAPRWLPENITRDIDKLSGARLTQLTSAAMVSHNIYCEERYTSKDGSRAAILRGVNGREEMQLWVIDLSTGQVAKVCDQIEGFPTSPLNGDNLYFIRPGKSSPRILCRFNLMTFVLDELFDMTRCPETRHAVCSISPDERYYLGKMRTSRTAWGFYRIDLKDNSWAPFHEHEEICNPHPQYEPTRGEQIMVQHNRGCVIDEEENIIHLVGEVGATLYLLSGDGKTITRLPVGKPYTPPVTGHECWVADTGKILLSTAGNELHLLTPGEAKSKLLWKGMPFNHVSASNDGKYFVTDSWPTGILYVGSLITGRLLPLCDSKATCRAPQHTHPHAYMTPDNRFVIYNSDVTGLGQVWSAELPQGFLATLDVPVA